MAIDTNKVTKIPCPSGYSTSDFAFALTSAYKTQDHAAPGLVFIPLDGSFMTFVDFGQSQNIMYAVAESDGWVINSGEDTPMTIGWQRNSRTYLFGFKVEYEPSAT